MTSKGITKHKKDDKYKNSNLLQVRVLLNLESLMNYYFTSSINFCNCSMNFPT